MSRVLLDQSCPRPFGRLLTRHVVRTADQEGWAAISNGELLRAAEQAGFDVFVTSDQNIPHQNRLSGKRLALVVLLTNAWPVIRAAPERAVAAVDGAMPGSYQEVAFPRLPRRAQERRPE